ncbi:MAG: sigma 54-interacting transcriptional regulator [Myxococcales bacterium]|nr:sigma 54-interacting transcriptional regulator [Myxococcales bacterium]
MADDSTTAPWSPQAAAATPVAGRPTLVLLACVAQPDRVGELAFLDTLETPHTVGRHGTLPWARVRPGHEEPTGPIADSSLSRVQLTVSTVKGRTEVHNVGQLPLRLNGRPATRSALQPGDLLELGDRVLLRVSEWREPPAFHPPSHAFGHPDALGWVGESAASWALRARVAFVAPRLAHVLVTGASGSGKELVARGLHALSDRGTAPLVSRNAATIPESIADAELFGHAAGYPNPGMPERRGLVGEADGSTLFLDEFGELPTELQARLLRVLDDGEYARLGEARPRRADIRLIAATNRDPQHLKHDVLARLTLDVEVPGLGARIDDIPLLAAYLMRRIARADDVLAQRFFDDGNPDGHPRWTTRLVRQLVCRRYDTHVRELERSLWKAISAAPDDVLDAVGPAPPTSVPAPVHDAWVDPNTLDPEVVQAALDRHDGLQEPVWKELGLSSRHVLARFVKKHGLRVRSRS